MSLLRTRAIEPTASGSFGRGNRFSNLFFNLRQVDETFLRGAAVDVAI